MFKEFKSYYYIVLKELEKALTLSKADNTEDAARNIQYVLKEQIYAQLNQEALTQNDRYYIQKSAYLQVALTDEIFLSTPWEGANYWKQTMLEKQIFDTQSAGDTIFQDINKILYEPQKTPQDIVQLYLLTLSLGFKGETTQEAANEYKHQLFTLLYPLKKSIFTAKEAFVMPQVLMHTLEYKGVKRFLSDTRFWILTSLLVVGTYIVISTVFWYSVQSDVACAQKTLQYQIEKGHR